MLRKNFTESFDITSLFLSAVALILGILIGTYASIMIGTPVMFDSTKKVGAKK